MDKESATKNISIVCSTKSDGDLLFKNDPATPPDIANDVVRENREQFFRAHAIPPERVVNICGVHGNRIYRVRRDDLGKGALDPATRIARYDGLVTNVEGAFLMVTGADCFPVFFWDEESRAIGAAHAGWRGIAKKIIPFMIDAFRDEYHSSVADIRTWIGPGIQEHHYDVSEERAAFFASGYPRALLRRDNKIFLDLPAVIHAQLIESGVEPAHISAQGDCTFCADHAWFSHRRDHDDPIKSAAFLIGFNPA